VTSSQALCDTLRECAMQTTRVEMSSPKTVNGWFHRQTRRFWVRPRWSVAIAVFIVLTAVFSGSGLRMSVAFLLGFDISALVFLGSMAHMFAYSSMAKMRLRSRMQDTGRWGVLWISVGLSVVVLVALGLELHADNAGGIVSVIVAGASLLLSWLFMSTIFAQHYAHLYYGNKDMASNALIFPGTGEPDYWDFLYFAVVVGMTFQVSDVQVADRNLRRTVLVQSVISFFFNVIIIAISVNVVAGKV
jgi:uncharacterized membrane protein